MKRVSDKRRAEFAARPAIPTVSEDRTPVRPIDESFREFVRRLPCVVCLKPTLGGDPCHRKTKRVSGDWLDVGGELSGNIYPACREHHVEQHSYGIATFAGGHSLKLAKVCKAVGEAYTLGWSSDALGVEARARGGYTRVSLADVGSGELPY